MSELVLPKPQVPKELADKPIPDLLVYRSDTPAYDIHKGTPEGVAKRLREMTVDRDRIMQMWRAEGKTRTYIPNTAEARTMKMKAKLQNRVETKHAEVVKKFVNSSLKAIELPPDTEWTRLTAVEI